MLINKLLASKGFIFSKSADLAYIKMLFDLGAVPILVHIESKVRHIIIVDSINYINNYNYFNYDICSISDIKGFLRLISINLKQGTSLDDYLLRYFLASQTLFNKYLYLRK